MGAVTASWQGARLPAASPPASHNNHPAARQVFLTSITAKYLITILIIILPLVQHLQKINVVYILKDKERNAKVGED